MDDIDDYGIASFMHDNILTPIEAVASGCIGGLGWSLASDQYP